MEKIPDIIHESWHKYLQPLFDDNKMSLIKTSILPNCKFYPDAYNIFRVFSMPLEDIKVVILGQDPYPNGEAIGYSFAVNRDNKVPASLRVMTNEIDISKAPHHPDILPIDQQWKTLQHWVEQGVFLLNSALTVQAQLAGSHNGYWMWFTKRVIEIISVHHPVIWMLWGAKAQSFEGNIATYHPYRPMEEPTINKAFNYVLKAPHPAAELYGGAKKFTGCNHFLLCDEILTKQEKQIIYW